jgi:hypothetical protein
VTVLSLIGVLGVLRFIGFIPQSWYYAPLMAVSAVALNGVLGAPPRATSRWRPLWAWAPAAAVVLAAALTWSSARSDLEQRQTNMDLVAQRLSSLAAPQDLVLVNPWYFGISFQRYYRGEDWRTIPEIADHEIHRYDLVKEKMLAIEPIAGTLDAIERTLRAGHRVWVVGLALPPARGAPPAPPPLNREGGRANGERHREYLSWWERQAGYLVETHATSAEPVTVPVPDAVSLQENAALSVYSGWKP